MMGHKGEMTCNIGGTNAFFYKKMVAGHFLPCFCRPKSGEGSVLFPFGIALRGGGGEKACQDGLEHIFPTFAQGVRACQDGLQHFFSTFARLTEEGLKAIWAMPL